MTHPNVYKPGYRYILGSKWNPCKLVVASLKIKRNLLLIPGMPRIWLYHAFKCSALNTVAQWTGLVYPRTSAVFLFNFLYPTTILYGDLVDTIIHCLSMFFSSFLIRCHTAYLYYSFFWEYLFSFFDFSLLSHVVYLICCLLSFKNALSCLSTSNSILCHLGMVFYHITWPATHRLFFLLTSSPLALISNIFVHNLEISFPTVAPIFTMCSRIRSWNVAVFIVCHSRVLA